MDILIKIIVCFFAGAGAGIGTGFAGMSAAAVVGPMLISFLGIPPYEAVGIGLASDVLASAVSSYNYKKSKNIDIKNGIVMMIAVLVMTIVGSFIAKFLPERAMGNTMQISMIIIGLRFLLKPVMTTKAQMEEIPQSKRIRNALIGGIVIGFICGFIGAGGGMMMLFILTSFLGYELHTAVGTSVFIMTFTALTGAVSHFTLGNMPDILTLVLCVIFTFIWAQIASKIANKSETKTLNRVVGAVLIITSAVILTVNFMK
ncbi:MAG: sulfite exporter TauE/SafE family protein [Oscillospiraceae bacterium]|nr:sulfite exporter TauE/SafE family protein [Oscillospiraceae bacterium]